MDKTASNRSTVRLLIPLLSLVFFVAGCSGEKRHVVRGMVFLDGQPLTSGVVQFHGANERLATGVIQTDGTFVVTDLLPGEVRVAVVEDLMAMPKGKGDKRSQVPAKYRAAATSGLSYTITPATRDLEIKLLSSK
jgi:hypothetical protein